MLGSPPNVYFMKGIAHAEARYNNKPIGIIHHCFPWREGTEVKLIKSTGNVSSPVRSNPVLTFKTATRTGLFSGTTQINAKQLEKYIAHIPPSSNVCATLIFPIGRATRADGTLMPTNQFELANLMKQLH